MENNTINKENNLRLAIFKTLTWFDLFNYPLAAYELWQYLDFKCEFSQIQAFSIQEPLGVGNRLFETQSGFYFLPGRSEIIKTRLARYNYTDQKFKRALRLARLFRLCPFVKLIAVSNIIGAHNLRVESDIDLFIVTAPQRIWLTRFFCAGLTKLLNLRPNKITKQNKICLSFYISEENLNLVDLKLDEQDFYFNYWLAGLIPIYDKDNTYQRLMAANRWLKNYLPNFIAPSFNSRRQIKKIAWLKDLWRADYLEKLSQKWQLKIMPQALKELINRDSRVIVKDGIIKLYLVDRREELRNKFRAKVKVKNLF